MDRLEVKAPKQEASAPVLPHAFLKSLFSVAHDLSAVQRFSRLRMVHQENCLAHTGMVCIFAYAIASTLQDKAYRELRPLDLGAVLARAVVHDWDETITGDIVRPTKYFSNTLRGELGLLERLGIENIAIALGIGALTNDFKMSKAGREGYVVKIADFFAALCTVYIEVCVNGNRAMVQPAQPMKALLDSLRPTESQKWSPEELKVIDELLDEAYEVLTEILRWSNPLPSLHREA